jgi:hypothetical protein
VKSISLALCDNCFKSFLVKRLKAYRFKENITFVTISRDRSEFIKTFYGISEDRVFLIKEESVDPKNYLLTLKFLDHSNLAIDLLLEEIASLFFYLVYTNYLDLLEWFIGNVRINKIMIPFGDFLKEDLEEFSKFLGLRVVFDCTMWDERFLAIIKGLKMLDTSMRGTLYRFWVGLKKDRNLVI